MIRSRLMQGQSDAMVGHSILREIVSPDLFAAISAAHLAAPLGANLLALFIELDFI